MLLCMHYQPQGEAEAEGELEVLRGSPGGLHQTGKQHPSPLNPLSFQPFLCRGGGG